MEHLPLYIDLIFGLTVLLALIVFYMASQNSTPFLSIAFVWILIQSVLGLMGFFILSKTAPPKLALQVGPPLLLIAVLFLTKRGRGFINRINIKTLTILHIVRIPVELVLYGLAAYKAVPVLITFAGRNFDILSGLTAPLIYYFGFVKNKLGKAIIVAWNLVCLALLFYVVVNAVLSAPTPFQQFAFNQPNIAIGYFPFVLLPAFIVPLVMFAHLAAIKQLVSKNYTLINSNNFHHQKTYKNANLSN
jgi:hypothetical protein